MAVAAPPAVVVFLNVPRGEGGGLATRLKSFCLNEESPVMRFGKGGSVAFATLTGGEGAVARCVATYNGTKWKGNQLRVERAKKEYYLDVLRKEWEATARLEELEERLHRQAKEERLLAVKPMSSQPLRLLGRDGRSLMKIDPAVQRPVEKRKLDEYIGSMSSVTQRNKKVSLHRGNETNSSQTRQKHAQGNKRQRNLQREISPDLEGGHEHGGEHTTEATAAERQKQMEIIEKLLLGSSERDFDDEKDNEMEVPKMQAVQSTKASFKPVMRFDPSRADYSMGEEDARTVREDAPPSQYEENEELVENEGVIVDDFVLNIKGV